jgi:hypothetical protein
MANQPLGGPNPSLAPSSRPWQVVGLVLILFPLSLGAFLVCNAQTLTLPGDEKKDEKPPSPLFRNWGKSPPDLAIAVTGQMYGYLQPCGCSDPQFGGLSRRYNFLKSLRDKGWPLVAVDLGDLSPRGGPQAALKYETAMKALGLMKYSAIGLGKNEFYLPLEQALVVPLNNKLVPRIVAANLNADDLVLPWKVIKEGKTTFGVTGVIGPEIIKEGESKFDRVKFNQNAGKQVLLDLGKNKPDLVMILFQGSEEEAKKCAEICAKLHKADAKYPKVDVMLCLEKEEEPSGNVKKVGDTLLIGIGHKGRYVGVLGAFRTRPNGPFEFKYQLVSIGPEWKTPEAREKSNPVMALMEDYARRVKEGGYITKFPRSKHPVQLTYPNSKYIGSETCGNCHPHAYKIWEDKENTKESKHSRAFETLVKRAKHPSLRQFDGECVACHTVGFQHNTGYMDPANKPKQNLRLLNVGCENCHGPGSDHANNPNNVAIQKLMNPFKAKADEGTAAKILRLNQLDHFCQKCHDIDNDVTWGKVPFEVKWSKIAHPTPKKPQVRAGK